MQLTPTVYLSTTMLEKNAVYTVYHTLFLVESGFPGLLIVVALRLPALGMCTPSY